MQAAAVNAQLMCSRLASHFERVRVRACIVTAVRELFSSHHGKMFCIFLFLSYLLARDFLAVFFYRLKNEALSKK